MEIEYNGDKFAGLTIQSDSTSIKDHLLDNSK